jgi:hypothetical protein
MAARDVNESAHRRLAAIRLVKDAAEESDHIDCSRRERADDHEPRYSLPLATPVHCCKRGLHIAPWSGDAGELVLLAIRSDNRLAAPPVSIPWNADSERIAMMLEELLDIVDPPGPSRVS